MRRALIVTLAALAVLLVASQLLLPRYVEAQIEGRLEKGGGSATADVSAFPALTLAARSGSALRVTGEGLAFDLTTETKVFENLDGFGEVDVEITRSRAGPVELDAITLERTGRSEPYDVALSGRLSPREVARFMAGRFGGPLGGLLGDLGTLTLTDAQLPFEASAQIRSEDGVATVLSSDGTVAGLPAGPLAEVVAAAVVSRL